MIPLVSGILVAILLAPAGLPAADDPWLEPPREKDLARVREKIETLRAWRISEELDLDEKTSARLFSAMREADDEVWRIEVRNRKLMRELKAELEKDKNEPARISEILDHLRNNRMEKVRAEDRHFLRVREILTPEDTARYLMFQLKFQRELQERAARAFRESPDGMDGKMSDGSDSDRHSGSDGDSHSKGGKRR